MSKDPQFRILILTAGFGDGHNAAARGVEAALRRRGGRVGIDVAVEDVFDAAHPGLSRLLKDAYRFGIVHFPRGWRLLYDLSDRVSFKNDTLGLFRKLTLRLKSILECYRPNAVVITYPVYPQLLEAIVGRHGELPFRVLTVITDAVSINQTWLKGRTDIFLVCDEDSRRVLLDSGIAPDRIRASGFPVDPVFGDLVGRGLPDARWEAPARLLFFPSTPARHVAKTLDCLAAAARENGLRLTVVLGRHARRLARTVARARDGFPEGALEVLGWTDEVPRLLRAHHAVIGKAGGASVQEALAARRPFIVNYIVPGQEEGNARVLVASGCGLVADTPDQLRPILGSLFADGGRRWLEMTARTAAVSKPRAAIEIARLALGAS